METGTVDGPLTGRPSLASSWDAACGALAQRLHLTRADLGARDADWEELLAPPDTSQDLVVLKRNLNSQDENPCFLYLRCDPGGGEEIVSIGILSSARNMEVYLGEEYCGTSRGKNVCNVLDNSEHEKIILYKNYLELESSTHACKIKVSRSHILTKLKTTVALLLCVLLFCLFGNVLSPISSLVLVQRYLVHMLKKNSFLKNNQHSSVKI
ncbi:Uncharacterized protein Cadr_000009676 [Camelus dromedarius]|uniref:Uncharacterized protein n=1 Tax=Camelus dromedarius TaxID=9838 RepID=A0A5N4DIU0_CAMDR|nr:Uncharacterized protein Cadr_000009676 [Camelus dromedarius]